MVAKLASGAFLLSLVAAVLAVGAGIAYAAGVEASKPVPAFVAVIPQTTSSLPGDIDANGTVNGFDLALVTSDFNGRPPRFRLADLNSDGIVDVLDLALVGINYGRVE